MNQAFNTKWSICRICLKSENKKLYSIFAPTSEDEITDFGTTLIDKIELCGAIKLNKQHNLPSKICNRCVLLLRAAYKFRDLCQQSQTQLGQFITTLPQKEESDETLETNFNSDGEDKIEFQEVSTEPLIDADYVVEETVEEYDHTSISYPPYQNSVQKNDFITILDDDVEIQNLSDDDNSQYVLEEEAKEFTSRGNEDESTIYNYDQDSNSDNIIIEEQPKNSERKSFIKRTNEKKAAVKRKRKRNKLEEFINIYNCTFCDNTYTDKTKYSNHIKIHVKDRPHECEICKKHFSTTPQLSRHMNSHTGNRPYKCQYCEASFGDPSTKIKHERIHTNERPYKCSMCDKAFAYSNVLKVHMMTHTGEKPHNCVFCGKSFSQLHHKNAHEKRHTKPSTVILQNSAGVEYLVEDELKDFVEEII